MEEVESKPANKPPLRLKQKTAHEQKKQQDALQFTIYTKVAE